jgi:hypothetical protein
MAVGLISLRPARASDFGVAAMLPPVMPALLAARFTPLI